MTFIQPGTTLQVIGHPAEDKTLIADVVRVMDIEMECERVRE